jgi:hypothetical protein
LYNPTAKHYLRSYTAAYSNISEGRFGTKVEEDAENGHGIGGAAPIA